MRGLREASYKVPLRDMEFLYKKGAPRDKKGEESRTIRNCRVHILHNVGTSLRNTSDREPTAHSVRRFMPSCYILFTQALPLWLEVGCVGVAKFGSCG